MNLCIGILPTRRCSAGFVRFTEHNLIFSASLAPV